MSMRELALAFSASILLVSASASAHFNLDAPPPPKPTTDGGKGAPPCGPDTSDGTVTEVKGGDSMMLAINETVPHGGFYRVALALKSCKTKDCFPADNTVYDSKNMVLTPTSSASSDHADYEMNPKFPVLADHLFPQDTGVAQKYMAMVPIPNFNCDKCTVQVIEFMSQHPSNGAAGYFYHHCADIKITADTSKPLFDPNNMGGGGSGGSGGGGGMAGASGMGGAATAGAAGMAAGGAAAGSSAAGGSMAEGGTPVAAGAPSSGGTPPAAGGSTGMSSSGTGETSSSGTGTASSSSDSGGCAMAPSSPGASAIAALGVLLGLVRRRRSR
jgi:hypothetical protein